MTNRQKRPPIRLFAARLRRQGPSRVLSAQTRATVPLPRTRGVDFSRSFFGRFGTVLNNLKKSFLIYEKCVFRTTTFPLSLTSTIWFPWSFASFVHFALGKHSLSFFAKKHVAYNKLKKNPIFGLFSPSFAYIAPTKNEMVFSWFFCATPLFFTFDSSPPPLLSDYSSAKQSANFRQIRLFACPLSKQKRGTAHANSQN